MERNEAGSFVLNEKGQKFVLELERRINIIERRLDFFERYINATAITGDTLQMFHEMRDSLVKEIHQMKAKDQL